MKSLCHSAKPLFTGSNPVAASKDKSRASEENQWIGSSFSFPGEFLSVTENYRFYCEIGPVLPPISGGDETMVNRGFR
jgi:hypothetical protein